jgi:hypothetical protein
MKATQEKTGYSYDCMTLDSMIVAVTAGNRIGHARTLHLSNLLPMCRRSYTFFFRLIRFVRLVAPLGNSPKGTPPLR